MKRLVPILLLPMILSVQCHLNKSGEINLQYTPDKVELFGRDIVSTNLYERDIAISPKGDEIIFTLCDYRQTKRCLVVMKKTGSKWSRKGIFILSGKYRDIEPCFSVDGNKLYFASNRPIDSTSDRKDFNIWASKRTFDGWSIPEPLQSNINTENDEFFPSVSQNGNLYFTSVRENGIGSEDIFLSRYIAGRYLDPEPLDSNINTPTFEFNAYISPDENLIIFSSYGRKDDLGGGDLYYSKKNEQGNWIPAVNMGPSINSDQLDYCPFIDIFRGNFYFTSERILSIDKRIEDVYEIEATANSILNGMGNIYRVRLDRLNLD